MNLEKIIVVIVLYKSSLEESVSFQTLLQSISCYDFELTLIVYNNSPHYWNYDQEQYKGLNIVCINDFFNSGVSKAYNIAFTYAKRMKKDYLVLLDQDTTLSKSFFGVLIDDLEKYKSSNMHLFCPKIMNKNELVSPAKFFLYTSKKIGSISTGIHLLKELAIINSGLIISTQLFELVGGYNEKIKLDFSDFDFLKRCLYFCQKIVILNTCCYHSLSSEEKIIKDVAINRFGYYIEGAKYLTKSKIDGIGLPIWVFLRSIKLNLRYNTLGFTKKLFQFNKNNARHSIFF